MRETLTAYAYARPWGAGLEGATLETLDAVAAVVAVAAPAVLVLREVAAPDRSRAREVDPDTLSEPAPELVAGPVLGVGVPPAAAPVDVPVRVPKPAHAEPPREVEPVRAPAVRPRREPETDLTLSAIARATETDERSVFRRVGALVVLIGITLATAALVGAGIYRAVAGLG